MNRNGLNGCEGQTKFNCWKSTDIQRRWHLNFAKNTICYHLYMISRSGGGCWFCPNARYFELKHLRSNHRDLWKRLLDLEDEENLVANIWNMLTGRSMKDNEEMFFWEEAQMNIYDFLED